MPIQGRYPNDMFMVDLKGDKRLEYMRAVVGLYNDLKGKGYPVPSATIVDEEGDESYITFEGVMSDSLEDKVSMGVVSDELLRDVYSRVLAKLKKIRMDVDVIVYNQSPGSICYDEERDKFLICDLTQCNKLSIFGRVKQFTLEHIEKMNKKYLDSEL